MIYFLPISFYNRFYYYSVDKHVFSFNFIPETIEFPRKAILFNRKFSQMTIDENSNNCFSFSHEENNHKY